ncbi:MAG: DHH family phosphoesterase [Candidatus Babeliales bacterium]|jgi:phosphoesterase RecJ-like protein
MANATSHTYTMKDLKEAWALIQHASHITLLTHNDPDADGMSACAALSHVFENIGKKIETIYPNQPEFPTERQARTILINKHVQKPDLIIIVDTARFERAYFPQEFSSIPLINIDHHTSNNIKGLFNFVNPDAASACEELFVILHAWNEPLVDLYVAQSLLCGTLYDSQVFQTSSTTDRTLAVALELMHRGANLFEIKNELLSSKNPQIIALWSKILATVTLSPSKTAAWVLIRQSDMKELGAKPSSLVGINNFLGQICGIDVTAIFYETETGEIKVSLRSKITDVNALAQRFGGGGHKYAAGVRLEKPFDTVVAEVTKLLK